MKIYLSHASSSNYQEELYDPLKNSELYSQHEIFLPHEAENVDTKAMEALADTDVVVAEVSYPSTGQGIELGLASSAEIPIACFYREGTTPSDSLRFVCDQFIVYTNGQDFLQKLTTLLESK